MGLRSRQYLLPVHRWLGLTAGLLVLLVAITGAGMAFRTELEAVVAPELLIVPACSMRLPLDTLVDNAHAAYPNAGRLTLVRAFGANNASTRIALSDNHWIYLDPCRGNVLGRQEKYGGLFGTLGYLHGFRFFDQHDIVAGSIALFFALLLLLGSAVWLPATWRAFRFVSKINPRLRGRARLLNLHQCLGLYASPILLISALTGAPQVLDWLAQGLRHMAGDPAMIKPVVIDRPANAKFAPLEASLQEAQRRVPQYRKLQLRYPKNDHVPIVMELVGQDAPHMQALSVLEMNPYSAKVIRFTPYAQSHLGQRLYQWMLAVHYGWVGGLFGQLLLFLAALCVPVLAWTGLRSYLLRICGDKKTVHKKAGA